MLLAMNAEDDAVVFHGPEHIAADPFAHGHAVLGIGGAMWWVVFAGAQSSVFCAFFDHRRGGIAGEVEGDDEFLEGICPCGGEVGPVTLNRPRRFGGWPRNAGHWRQSVWHGQRARTAHAEMGLDITWQCRPLAEMGVKVKPLGEI